MKEIVLSKDLNKLLNLMCIESLTQNGIKNYYSLKRDILNIYGYQNIFLFRDLETIGWLKEKVFLNNILIIPLVHPNKLFLIFLNLWMKLIIFRENIFVLSILSKHV